MDEGAYQATWPELEQPGPLVWLQGWYASQCDGDWEHSEGISIDTLDNPGWSVTINLSDTAHERRSYDRVELHRSEHDWHISWIEKSSFHAACGPLNLGEVLHLFRTWIQAEA